MTDLGQKIVKRRVYLPDGTTLIVALTPTGLMLKEPRRRTGYLVPYGHAFLVGARLSADQQRAEKKSSRMARPRRLSRGLLTTGR